MQSILSVMINVVVWFMRILSPSVALVVGRLGGIFVYAFDKKHRRLVYQNLKYAFAQERSLKEIRQLARRFFMNLGANFVEFLRQPLLDPEAFKKIIEFEGVDHIYDAAKQGRGIVAMTMHYGNWEFSTLATSLTGYQQAITFKSQENASAFNKVMIACRKDAYKNFKNICLYEKGFTASKFIKALRNKEVAGMVIDQSGKDGIPVKFFGRYASFSTGGVRLAMKMGAPICIGAVVRQEGLKHKLYVEKFELAHESDDEKENFLLNLRKIAHIFEDVIRKNPEQYMWMYKIWKYDQSKNIMILDDARVGHLRQSQAVSYHIRKEVEARNGEVAECIVPVEYKGRRARFVILLTALIAKFLPDTFRLWILKTCLKEESFKALSRMKADIVVSAGSFSAPLNCLIADEHHAKSIHLLRPGILPWSRFDLLIMPKHDKPGKSKHYDHVIFTKGAPNLINDDYLQEFAQRLEQRYSHLKFRDKFKIGVLLGGDTKDYVLDESQAKIIIHQIKEVAEQLDADVIITTSRRTSEKVENLFMREFKKYSRCPLLIIANRSNIPEAVGGILAVSDVIVVTGDSISMVSEAASSGRKTVVVPIKGRDGSAKHHKHHRFVDRLNAKGYILCSSARMLKSSIFDLAKNKIYLRKLDDYKKLQQGIAKIL